MKKKNTIIILTILLIIDLLIISLIGYYKNSNNNFKKNIKDQTWKEVELNDKQILNNIAIGLFNDAYKYITFEDEDIRISDDGKITATAKAMYLNNELAINKKINDETKTMIENKAQEIFGTKTKFTDFTINMSQDYCGVDAYNSKSVLLKDKTKEATGKCKLPFIIFQPGKAQTSGNNYVLKVYVAFIKQENITSANSCKKNEETFGNIISVYSDPKKTQSIYATKVTGCCTKGNCDTQGIKNESEKIKKLAIDNDSYYNLYFEKKANKIFELKNIKRR